METLSVQALSSFPAIMLEGSATVKDAIAIIHKTGYRRIPVRIGPDIEGIISASHIVSLLQSQGSDFDYETLVGEIMEKHVLLLNANDPLVEALKRVYYAPTGCVIVRREESSEWGICCERDFIWADILWESIPSAMIDEEEGIGTPVTPDLFISPDFSLWQAADKLASLERRNLLIGDPINQTPTSILTTVDIVKALEIHRNRILADPEFIHTELAPFPYHAVSGLPVPQSTSSVRRWMGVRGFGAFPLLSRGRAVKMIDEHHLTRVLIDHYLS